MNESEFYYLGKIIKTIGKNGQLSIVIDADDPHKYQTLKSVYIALNGQYTPFFIHSIKINETHAIIELEGVKNHEEAILLTGCELFLPVTMLPALKGNHFYLHEIIGYLVINASSKEKIGTIENIIGTPGQYVFQIIHTSGKEILLPVHEGFIVKVDRLKNELLFSPPEGLIDLYLKQ